MIETLNPGIVPSDKFVGQCHRCGGRFRFGRGDAKRHYAGDQRDGPFAQIKCPTPHCNNTVTGYPEKS